MKRNFSFQTLSLLFLVFATAYTFLVDSFLVADSIKRKATSTKAMPASAPFYTLNTFLSKENNNNNNNIYTSRIQQSMFQSEQHILRAGVDEAAEAKYSSVSNVNVVILAGGVGSRMKADRPKQLLNLLGMPVLCHSIELFSKLRGVDKIIIVLDPSHREPFEHYADKDSRIQWALPGKERQDSVFNGLSAISEDCSLVCIHDAARPLVTMEEILHVIGDAEEHGAAVLGVPMKATVKESEDGEFVLRTVPRSRLWEIHTPQVIKPKLLKDGFKKVSEENLEVTDDVSIIEQLGLPVKLTQGEYTNLKITTPEDMPMAEEILSLRKGLTKNGIENGKKDGQKL